MEFLRERKAALLRRTVAEVIDLTVSHAFSRRPGDLPKKLNFLSECKKLKAQTAPEFWLSEFEDVYNTTGTVPWDCVSRALASINLGTSGAFNNPHFNPFPERGTA